jgi:hypothetical protein
LRLVDAIGIVKLPVLGPVSSPWLEPPCPFAAKLDWLFAAF